MRSVGQSLTNSGATITVTANALLYVDGALQNATGSSLTNAGTLRVDGNFTNAGAFTSTGTLLFGGNQDQACAPGAASLAALAVNNKGAVGANRLFISADLIVTSLLSLQQGLVRTQGSAGGSALATLSLPDGGMVVGEGPGQYVQG